MKGIVNKIIPFSNVDGPGNRLSIFFQGCNFDCLYCHNPETIEVFGENKVPEELRKLPPLYRELLFQAENVRSSGSF